MLEPDAMDGQAMEVYQSALETVAAVNAERAAAAERPAAEAVARHAREDAVVERATAVGAVDRVQMGSEEKTLHIRIPPGVRGSLTLRFEGDGTWKAEPGSATGTSEVVVGEVAEASPEHTAAGEVVAAAAKRLTPSQADAPFAEDAPFVEECTYVDRSAQTEKEKVVVLGKG